MIFDRAVFFDKVRQDPFPGTLNQSQVDGMSYILDIWEEEYPDWDIRWLAYALATTYHETAATMQPIEEYGKGAGHSYGVEDPTTGQTYYGRGFVQLTWRDNYAKADRELDFVDDASCEWHAENALDPGVAAEIMFTGMEQGWFRPPNNFALYFNDTRDDPFGAREIINGDKTIVPSWSSGARIGDLIVGYHDAFLRALEASLVVEPPPLPPADVITITITAPPGTVVIVNGTETIV